MKNQSKLIYQSIHVLQGLPIVKEWFKESPLQPPPPSSVDDDDDDNNGSSGVTKIERRW